MAQYNYEESVRWMREQPELSELVKLCYLDEDNLAAARRFASSEEFAAISKILGLTESSKVLNILDLGCGNGIVSYAFASLGHKVHAVDPDESNDVGLGAISRLVNSGIKGSITVHRAFAESLPFDSGMFDVVYTRQAVHHFADLQLGLKECSRVLRNQGLFLATREHIVDDEQQLQEFLENHILHKMHGGENAYPLPTYLSALQAAGLRVTRSFSTFDTVINHFPMSNVDVVQSLESAIGRKIGRRGGALFAKSQLLENLYRSHLSSRDNSPGRLHTFLAVK